MKNHLLASIVIGGKQSEFMKRSVEPRKIKSRPLFALLLLAPAVSFALTQFELQGKLSEVAVTGGADTYNPGTSCVKLDVAVPPTCIAGWIAIPNNNKKLTEAALAAKLTASPVSVYFVSDGASQHCPNRAFTPCTVISIGVR